MPRAQQQDSEVVPVLSAAVLVRSLAQEPRRPVLFPLHGLHKPVDRKPVRVLPSLRNFVLVDGDACAFPIVGGDQR